MHECEACGRSSPTPRTVYVVKGHPIRRCSGCALLWADAPEVEPQAIYTEAYFQGGVSDGYFDYLGSERLLGAEHRARLAFVRRHAAGGRLLEVGCATGGFLEVARSAFQVEGIDVSSYAAGKAREKGLDVRTGSLLDEDGPGPVYDVVAMFDTIEHLPAPRATMERVFASLRPGGVAILSTGDASSALARLTGRRWRLMTPPQHLWFFGRESIRALLGRVGFEVVEIAYPWRRVPVSLMYYQLVRGAARPLPGAIGGLVIPVNLFDTMTVVARRPTAGAR